MLAAGALRLAAAAAAVAAAAASAVQLNQAPFIGILGSNADVSCDTMTARVEGAPAGAGSCFANFYELWLRQAGARVVGIPHDAFDNHKADLDVMLGSLNGVLFTGGGLSLGVDTAYYTTGEYIFKAVQAKNDAGVHFPLHGTCMGFEFLSILGAGGNHSVLQGGFDTEFLSLPLQFTAAAKRSTLFGDAPAEVLAILGTQNVTSNLHHDAVTPETYSSNPALSSFYNVLSTNVGRQGRAFVSTIEAKGYPIRGTQWHPERPQFEWNPELNLVHTEGAMTAMQYMANFFVGQARLNAQSVYASPAALALARQYSSFNMTRLPMNPDVLVGYDALLYA